MPREIDNELPELLRPLFWDHDFAQLDWRTHQQFITTRILTHGGWGTTQWLRRQLNDSSIRQFLERTHGRALSPRRLRFWEAILDLPHALVSQWLAESAGNCWTDRTKQ